jgi:hypothetical protein
LESAPRAYRLKASNAATPFSTSDGAIPDFALLGDYPIQFWQHLLKRDYAKDRIRVYLRCIGRLAELMKADRIALGDLDEAQAVALVAGTDWIQKRKIAATFIVRRFVGFLAERSVGKPASSPTAKEIARAELRQDYETYLRRQHGLSERTIFHSWRIADRFLEFRFGDEAGDLSRITSADIVGFLQQVTTRTPLLREKTLSSHLRNFFRHLFKAGKTSVNLSLAVPSVRQRYGTRHPTARSARPECQGRLLRRAFYCRLAVQTCLLSSA